ncbi:hypothetical protein ZWY2020_058469 [Hordeum vulgare]|nr:hypothetical protein ZWY2020_058469 [Hordeum vulgare]
MELPEDVRAADEESQPHFLIVTYPAQGHITPARHLARRLVRAAAGASGARVTICTPVSAFRKMFADATTAVGGGDEIREEGGVAYAAYSDGYDDGFDRAAGDYAHYMSQVRLEGARTLSGLLRRLGDRGHPVTCAVYTLLMPWVAGVAREYGVAVVAVFWIQPATALAAYYHYFRGSREAVMAAAASRDPNAEVCIPGLPPLRFRDLPSFLAVTSEDDPFACLIPEFRELIDALDGDREKPPTYVLANTFDAMEPDALASLRPHVQVVTVGPVLSFLHDGGHDDNSPNDLFDHNGQGYLQWLDTKSAKSVVYISFGSTSVMSKRQNSLGNKQGAADPPSKTLRLRQLAIEEEDDATNNLWKVAASNPLSCPLRYFPKAFKPRARPGSEVEDLGNLVKLYADWHSRLIPYYSFEQFVRKAEKVGASSRVRVVYHHQGQWVRAVGDCRRSGHISFDLQQVKKLHEEKQLNMMVDKDLGKNSDEWWREEIV